MNDRPLRLGVVGKSLTHKQWLAIRRKGIGGSDAAAVAGASDWSSPMSVYLDKVGATPPIEANEAMQWGLRLEAAVAAEFERENAVRIVGRQFLYRSRRHPFMLATIDGRYHNGSGEWLLYEGKTTGGFNREAWANEVPLSVYVQVQHNLAVTDYRSCGVACLIGGQRYVSYNVRRDDGFIKKLIQREREFYEQHVVPMVPPPVDGSSASSDALSALYPVSNGEQIDPLPDEDEALDLIDTYLNWQGEVKRAETERDNAANALKLMLADSDSGTAGTYRVSWASRTRKSLDAKGIAAEYPTIASKYMKETQYRVFSVKEMKDRD